MLHNVACQVVPLTYLLLLLLPGLVFSYFQLHFASSVLGSFHGSWTLEGKGRLLERIITHHPWSALTHSMTPDLSLFMLAAVALKDVVLYSFLKPWLGEYLQMRDKAILGSQGKVLSLA